MNISFLESFLVTARLQSLAKASEKLNLSHPALSKQMNSLEAYYGVKLFRRSPAGVTLTDHGKLLYERMVPVITELRAIKQELGEAGAANERRFTIGALPSLAARYLPEIVLSLEKAGIRIDIAVRHTSDELEELLKSGEAHAAVMELGTRHTALWNAQLFEEPYDAVVYGAHRFAGRDKVSISDIAGEPLIVNPPNCSTRKLFSSLIEECGGTPFVKSEVQFGDFILGFVAAGAGITFAPRISSEQLGVKGLTAVPVDDPRAKRTVSLVSSAARIGKLLLPYFNHLRI